MLPRLAVAVTIALVVLGCAKSTKPTVQPEVPHVTFSGIIRYEDGSIPWRSDVLAEVPRKILARCVTDSLGHYELTVPMMADSIRLFANVETQPDKIYGALPCYWIWVLPDRDQVVDMALIYWL